MDSVMLRNKEIKDQIEREAEARKQEEAKRAKEVLQK
jgi:hypothetical protein